MGSQDDFMNVVTLLFLELLTICATFQQKCQHLKLNFGCNKFGKRAVKNLPTRIHSQKKLRDQVDKIIGKLYLSKSIPNVCLKSISCQEACKLYLLMNNWNLRLQVWACQNASNETWIRAAKLFKNIQSALNIWIKCRPNFHKVECAGGNFTNPCQFSLKL